VYMGAEDIQRQELNFFRMQLMGAKVVPVTSGTKTLKDATNEAIRDWVTNVNDTHYIIGSVVGPHPYPLMVRDFQAILGREARQQILEQTGKLPSVAIACVGGGSNAMGLFHAFRDDEEVRLVGVEAGGESYDLGHHAASLSFGDPGVLHGSRSFLLQDQDGQVAPAHSVSAGLDYPGVGPEHAYLKSIQRAEYIAVGDSEALEACRQVSELEGIIPALETAHALAGLNRLAKDLPSDASALVCFSGRGDKDMSRLSKLIEV
ncbi:MAG: pyridoxal-phosphate dependent enzyme, partial [Candidatus Eisenbacteria bacterium]|nr:pyridoxal-phosphate dependent enzyme [Candidatus Eisenbacteria bacterium]